MHLYSFLALAGIALASPCHPDTYSSAGGDAGGNHGQSWSSSSASAPAPYSSAGGAGDGNHGQPWSSSSASTPAHGNHEVTSTATKGGQSSMTQSHHSAASTPSAYTWSVPKADPSAKVFPLHKRHNAGAKPVPVNTPSGWGDWNHGSSSTKSASGSKSTTSSTASSTLSSKTSYVSSTTESSSSSKGSSTSSSTSTTSHGSTSTTLSTLSTKTSTSSTSSSSSSSTVSSSSSTSSTSSSTSSSSGAFETTLLNPARNFFYTLDVTIGDTTYELDIDTGSSDTWAAAAAAPAGFTPIPDEYLYIAYVDGSYALGPLGTDSVTLAGLTVPSQIISIADQTSGFVADNLVGLIGLSFNQLTSAFPGTEPQISAGEAGPDPATVIHYSSIMNTIFNVDNLTPDLFSLALSRDPDEIANADQYGGVLIIGGEPTDLLDPTLNVTTPIVSTPMTDFNNSYLIDVTSITYGSQVLDQGVSYLVDSGTTLITAPDASVDAYWQQFSPAPGANGTVACDTTIPPLTVTIAGQDFPINPADLLRPSGTDDGICIINIAPSGDGTNILGDVFLQNVLAVFDWGAEAIRFGGREYYEVPT